MFKHRLPWWWPSEATERGSTIVYPPRNDPHRWAAAAGQLRPRGRTPLDAAARALLRELRRRERPSERWRRGVALALALLLHLVFIGVAWFAMQPQASRQVVHARLEDALQVRLIARAPAPPAAAPPALHAPPRQQRSPVPLRERPATGAMTVRLPSPAPARLLLFDRTGQPLLPAAAASAAGIPGYVARLPQGDAQVMRHERPLPYQATRLDRYFPPPQETVLEQGLRRALDRTHTNETAAVNLPGGVHLKCKTLLGIPTPFCQDPPPPASGKDGDERLNMAPAAPLAKALRPRQPPSLARCIALYRDGKPLSHGCPVDTPNRAVDAELADCIARYRAGRPVPAHCPDDTARRAANAPAAPVSSGSAGR